MCENSENRNRKHTLSLVLRSFFINSSYNGFGSLSAHSSDRIGTVLYVISHELVELHNDELTLGLNAETVFFIVSPDQACFLRGHRGRSSDGPRCWDRVLG